MEITQTEVTGLYRAQASAGLPKSVCGIPAIPKQIKHLGGARAGSGHDCFLKGIVVHSTVTADHSWWLQWMRYHFQDIISSTSKMHTILHGEVSFEDGTDQGVIKAWDDLRARCIADDTQDNFQTLIMSTPIGMLLTADTITNYLQLKTVYQQRNTHKMVSWSKYCDWIASLPGFTELTQKLV